MSGIVLEKTWLYEFKISNGSYLTVYLTLYISKTWRLNSIQMNNDVETNITTLLSEIISDEEDLELCGKMNDNIFGKGWYWMYEVTVKQTIFDRKWNDRNILTYILEIIVH